MTILRTVYASAPADEVIIPTLEILIPGLDPLRVAGDFDDHMLGVAGVLVKFQRGPLSVALPARDTTGQQTLKFGISGATGTVQQYVDAALQSGDVSTMIYREYLASNPAAPANNPVEMTIVGGQFKGTDAVFQGSYYDLLTAAWPRDNYTSETAPGILYL